MKKIFLLGMLFVSTVCNAQVVLWDGTNKEVNSDGGFWNRAEPTVVEEEGNKIMKFTLKDNPGGWDKEHCNFALPLGEVDFKALRRMTMRVKMAVKHNVLVKIVKDGDGGYNTGRLFWCGNPNEWNILTFEWAVGPESDKIVDTGNTVLEIWPFEEGDALSNVGQVVYIDDIKFEEPMVDGKGIRFYPDNSLAAEVKVTGVIGKGKYQNTWVEPWKEEAYDDYALIASKLASTVTKLDVSEAGRWDEDWSAIQAKCPGINIVTDATSIDGIETQEISAEGEYFNLNGQRVAHPNKGLYIVNGKKVIVGK
jgi:hypothetical protein